MNPKVSIQIIVHNGQDYIRHCLEAVDKQSYTEFDVTVLDNASTDGTKKIIREQFPHVRLIEHDVNLGMWPGQEYLLSHTKGEYVLALSVDVMLDKNFLTHAVAAFQKDERIGAIQGKLLQYTKSQLADGTYESSTTIDTCGFALARSRRVINIGHGEPDINKHAVSRPVFGVEGAAPIFRRVALEDIRIEGSIADPDYFWYGDDLDISWRMRLFGWEQLFEPLAIAWHDRSTTKGFATRWYDHLVRVSARQAIPVTKRRLDWSNVRFTIIKNEYIINILRDAPWFLAREIAVFFYTLFLEPRVFTEVVRFFRLLPRMLRRRKAVMTRARVTPGQMHHWYV